MRFVIFILGLVVMVAVPLHGLASGWKSKGEVRAEGRLFTDDDLDATEDGNLSLFTRLETGRRSGPWRVRLRAFGRVDRSDSSRDLTVFEEAWLGYRKGPWQVRAGYQLLNWTATEAFHPADIVNSRNLDSDIENPEKLGEAMISLNRRLGDGGLTLYYLPRFEAPKLPGPRSRLSFLPPDLAPGESFWIDDNGLPGDDHYESQWGGRFNQTIGDVDFSLHYLDHLDRQTPLFVPLSPDGLLNPLYLRVKDYGLTYLQILGAVIFKLEAAHKDFDSLRSDLPIRTLPDHTQLAFGLEYGWINGGGSESTLLVEGQTFLGVSESERASLGVFQRDGLIGLRHAFNDTLSRELLITAIFDLERSREYLFNFSYKQRLTDTWSLHAGLRWIDAPPPAGGIPTGLQNLDESNQVFLNISRFF